MTQASDLRHWQGGDKMARQGKAVVVRPTPPWLIIDYKLWYRHVTITGVDT